EFANWKRGFLSPGDFLFLIVQGEIVEDRWVHFPVAAEDLPLGSRWFRTIQPNDGNSARKIRRPRTRGNEPRALSTNANLPFAKRFAASHLSPMMRDFDCAFSKATLPIKLSLVRSTNTPRPAS